MKKQDGFTLIEILAVSGILVLLSITIVSLFISILRGGTKAEVVQEIRQGGDFALKAMSQVIRNAQFVAVDDCSEAGTSGSSIIVVDQSNNPVLFSLESDRIASDSSYLTSSRVKASGLSFICYDRDLGNQVVTVSFSLSLGEEPGAKAQEKQTEEFKTSVSLRRY